MPSKPLTDEDRAHYYVQELCERPDMWLTHGRPPDAKLKILEDVIATAIRETRADVQDAS